MNLTIESLTQIGAFTGAAVEKEITWMQGDKEVTVTVYVRPLSYLSAKSDLLATGGRGDPVAGRIAASICDVDGKPVFTPEDITGEADNERGPLDGNLTMALLAVIGEVNGLGKAQAKSNQKKKSGTSSSSAVSAEEVLPKPKSD